MSNGSDKDALIEANATVQDTAATGAAADAAEDDDELKQLPRILRIVRLRDREYGFVEERLIGDVAELCPALPQLVAWAAARDTDSAMALAAELDRLAAAEDRPELRSLADCVRLVSLQVPLDNALLSHHRRIAKSLLIAQQAMSDQTDLELAADVEAFAWGWAALPFARHLLPLYLGNRTFIHAARLGELMARRRMLQVKREIREQYAERDRKQKEEEGNAAAARSDFCAADHDPDESLVVCRIGEAMLKNPKLKEIVTPFKSVINTALPLVVAPPLHQARAQLLIEFPYAGEVIDFCLTDLVGRRHVLLRPLLLVGPAGGGKSRFCRRLGEVLGVSVFRVDASRSDGAVFGGTDKRWYSAEPAHPFLAVAQGKIANPLVMVDEIEKAATRSDYGRLWDCLLAFLEPETAARYPDPALQVPLDLSAVSYIATANTIDPLPSPIRDRFRVIEFPKPRASDFEALLPAVIADIAAERGLDARWMPSLDQHEHDAVRRLWRGGSVRRLRRVVEAIVNAREMTARRQ
jgi:ATP-dependent Lon protease